MYPVEELRKSGHQAAGFFYNPNIHPYSEYLKRRSEVEKYAKEAGLNVIYGEYDIETYFQHIVYNEAASNRCPVCWWMRMGRSATFAAQNGFEAFTTTLLGSPYQDVDTIKHIGEDVARAKGLKFYCADFRQGFKAAHELAKSKGIYCQNYCGCLFSEKERFEKRGKADGKEKKPGWPDRTITLGVKGSGRKIKCSI